MKEVSVTKTGDCDSLVRGLAVWRERKVQLLEMLWKKMLQVLEAAWPCSMRQRGVDGKNGGIVNSDRELGKQKELGRDQGRFHFSQVQGREATNKTL